MSHTDTDESGFSLLRSGAAGEEWGFLRKQIPLFALLLVPLVSDGADCFLCIQPQLGPVGRGLCVPTEEGI